MSKVAIVVQRCHESIVGGSESLAWQYAELLSDGFHVDILTTTALDYTTWANQLPEGVERRQEIDIHRFPVSITRSPYWHELHARWLRHYPYAGSGNVQTAAVPRSPWTLALQEEFIRKQGPYSKRLIEFLRTNWRAYRAILFVTYLYPTSYFGAAAVGRSRSLLVPTLHDEPAAYMKAYKHTAQRMRAVLWLTESEKQLGQRLWGRLPGAVIAMAVDTNLVPPAGLGYPYLLYSGRIDEGKGSYELIDYFRRMKNAAPSNLRLVLTGEDKIGVPAHSDIIYLGHVSQREKAALMAGADLFVMPSRWESFSIATLEAMAQRTPVLVNSSCGVLAEHVAKSEAGVTFADYASFCAAICRLRGDQREHSAMRTKAREYVVSRYKRERVRNALIRQIRSSDLLTCSSLPR
jgi:glycosyltransferase involved in cell wall biosynthesis